MLLPVRTQNGWEKLALSETNSYIYFLKMANAVQVIYRRKI